MAVQVQATVGRPGASAQARWRRARAAEWAVWTRSLPSRIAAILGIGAASGVLGGLVVPRLSLLIGGLATVVAGWGLRFRPSPDAVAWRRGAAGSGVPPGCFLRWSGAGGRSCTTWPSPAAGPTLIIW
jgi:hypothetical protein